MKEAVAAAREAAWAAYANCDRLREDSDIACNAVIEAFLSSLRSSGYVICPRDFVAERAVAGSAEAVRILTANKLEEK